VKSINRNEEDHAMAAITRTASAHWQGTGKEGKGTLTTQSGVLSTTPYGFNTRFGDTKGTNPEELLAAAHAGCFSMALAFGLTAAGFTPTSIATTARVTLEPDGPGFKISRSVLALEASVPNISREQFEKIAQGAKGGCPISKVLNAEITLDWKLA
jgi:osmotically inducible protein OsmC